jgi:hypothetical protein
MASSGASPSKASSSSASATRQGWRMAWSPPASAMGRNVAKRSKPP